MSINVSEDNYIVIEYGNKCDLAGILYQTGWKQRMFLDTDLVKPTYNTKQDGYEDGEGNFIPTFEREQKVYAFEILVHEFTLDALYLISMHDYVRLILKNGDSDLIKEIAIEHEPITSGIFKVKITFRTKYVIKTGCCDNNNLIACYKATHQPVLKLITLQGSEYTDPLNNGVTFNSRYLVRDILGTPDKIMIYSPPLGSQAPGAGTWVEEESVYGDVVKDYNGAGDDYWRFYNGVQYVPYPTITHYDSLTPGTILIKGFVIPNTYVYVYYKLSANPAWTLWGTVYTAGVYTSAGITLTGLIQGSQYDVKIVSWNHNCSYGSSNEIQQTVMAVIP